MCSVSAVSSNIIISKRQRTTKCSAIRLNKKAQRRHDAKHFKLCNSSDRTNCRMKWFMNAKKRERQAVSECFLLNWEMLEKLTCKSFATFATEHLIAFADADTSFSKWAIRSPHEVRLITHALVSSSLLLRIVHHWCFGPTKRLRLIHKVVYCLLTAIYILQSGDIKQSKVSI